MKKIAFIAVIILLLPVITTAQDSKTNDEAAIKQVALDYFEGWYTGSGERMARALSPELAKRYIAPGAGGFEVLRYSPYIMMVEYAASGMGKKPLANLNIKVEIFDRVDNIASVRITSVDYYDLLHIGKVNGEWKLIHVLWTPFQLAKDVGEAENGAIEAAIRNYIEGVYAGPRERTEKGLSPELAKRSIRKLPNGREFLAHTTYLELVAMAASADSTHDAASEVEEVQIFDVKGNIATAKLICRDFTDFIHIGKMNGEWKIINVLWASN